MVKTFRVPQWLSQAAFSRDQAGSACPIFRCLGRLTALTVQLPRLPRECACASLWAPCACGEGRLASQ